MKIEKSILFLEIFVPAYFVDHCTRSRAVSVVLSVDHSTTGLLFFSKLFTSLALQLLLSVACRIIHACSLSPDYRYFKIIIV